MALPAEAVRFLERQLFAAGKMERIAIRTVMTVKTPAVLLIVPEHNVAVHSGEFPPSGIGLHRGVAT
jgi:hypothetical protein